MDENMKKRNERLAQTVIKGLQSRNMTGYYAEDKEAALKQALELIEENSTISMGGCMSAHEIGLVQALQEGNYQYLDRSKMEPREGLLAAYDSDVFLSSANAMTSPMVSFHGSHGRQWRSAPDLHSRRLLRYQRYQALMLSKVLRHISCVLHSYRWTGWLRIRSGNNVSGWSHLHPVYLRWISWTCAGLSPG